MIFLFVFTATVVLFNTLAIISIFIHRVPLDFKVKLIQNGYVFVACMMYQIYYWTEYFGVYQSLSFLLN